MSSSVTALFRPELLSLKPYVSARTQAGGVSVAIALDANEWPWPAYGPMADLCDVNRYNDTVPPQLYERVAAVERVPVERLMMTRGSSEAIDLLIRLFCREGKDEILICSPTFSMYQVYAVTQGAKVIDVPLLENGQLDLPGIEKAWTPNTKLIFIPTPNAPMGHAMNKEDLLALCRARAGQSIIVADEAYIEFTDDADGLFPALGTHENLVVLRTLSKAFSLAGERLGMAIAGTEIIDMLLRIQAPFSIPQSSMRAALDALSPEGLAVNFDRRRLLKEERQRLLALLPQSPMIAKVYPSVTNFLFIQAKDLEAFVAALASRGIRGRANVCAIPRSIRLSLGTPEQNDLLLQALGVAVEKRT